MMLASGPKADQRDEAADVWSWQSGRRRPTALELWVYSLGERTPNASNCGTRLSSIDADIERLRGRRNIAVDS